MGRPNIILTGFMGCGKTTVGKLLARQLHYAFVDTDHLIEERSGMSIPEIFRTSGEEAFRSLETTVARELGAGEGMVIATGGRLMLDPDNARALEMSGAVFCLAARPEEILQRVSRSTQVVRPLLDTPDPMARIVELTREREASYARFPQISTSGKSPRAVMNDILARFESR
ncbi:MAG: hypothetical protein A2X81_13175 [Desulfobacterales bacterium GWB2_56_26]|nr:MAG: hypothetical protein A2X81_13175 [Desulfobacterales bacterium GWB2_56_26]